MEYSEMKNKGQNLTRH